MNETVTNAGLVNPSAITSTNLRKYVATVTQIVCLEKEELEWVADHLGHSIDVHRQFYRLQESTLEISKVSKLLLAIENGKVHEIANKKLSDISMEQCFPSETHGSKQDVVMQQCEGETDVVMHEFESLDNPAPLTDISNSLKHIKCEGSNSASTRKTLITNSSKSSSNTPRPLKLKETKNMIKEENISPAKCEGFKTKSLSHKSSNDVRPVWNVMMKTQVLKYFRAFIDAGKVPGKKECDKCIGVNHITGRSWKQVKYLVYNTIQKKKRV